GPVPAAGPGPADPPPAAPPPRPRPRPREEDIPTVLPVPTVRGQLAELSGSMVLAAAFAFLGTALWWLVSGMHSTIDAGTGTVFFLTVAACWAVLVPGKVWAYQRGDSWRRRLAFM